MRVVGSHLAIITSCILSSAFCLAASAAAQPWATEEDEARVAEGLRDLLANISTRAPGSPGNLALEEKVQRLFADSLREHGAIRFQAPAFLPGPATVTIPGSAPINLHPMHPSLFRPGNFPEKDFEAPIVYLGKGLSGDLASVKGISLQGALALMEFDCGANWQSMVRFGIKGFIFIAPEVYERHDALTKVYSSEVNIPRFLVESADGARLKKICESKDARARVQAEPSRWENRGLRDLWVLIPGADKELAAEVVVILAPLDSNCIVPGQALGAQSAINLYLLTQLLQQFSKDPPARSVLLCAVNAHTLGFQGERMLAWHLLAEASSIEFFRNSLNDDIRTQRLLADYYRRLDLKSYSKQAEEMLVEWRHLVDDTTGKNVSIKAPLVTMAKRDINRIKTEQAELFQQKLPKPEFNKRREQLEVEKNKFVPVLKLFNKIGKTATKLSDLNAEETDILRRYINSAIELNEQFAALNQSQLAENIANGAIRDVLQGRKVPMVISLGLDGGTEQLAFSSRNDSGTYQWVTKWGLNVADLAANLEEVRSGTRTNLYVDALTKRGGLFEEYFTHKEAGIFFFQIAADTPAFSLQNAFSSHGCSFLPSDTLSNLNYTITARNIQFAQSLLREMLNARLLTSSTELGKVTHSKSGWSPIATRRYKTLKFDPLAASIVPDIPVPGSVLILRERPEHSGMMQEITCGDVINARLALTDAQGSAIVYGLNHKYNGANYFLNAFHYNADYTLIDHAVDGGDISAKINCDVCPPLATVTLFECLELPLYYLADSSMLSYHPIMIHEIIPLTAKGNTSPRRYGFTGIISTTSAKKNSVFRDNFSGSMFFMPDERIKILTASKRLLLNSTDKEPEGRGYYTIEELGPDIFASIIKDMSVLNHYRLKRMRDVVNELVQEFLERGDRALERMNTALARNDHLQYLCAQYEALGSQVKSYEQSKQTSDDLLKAVVIYMALLLPFCFFVQKLLFKFVRIEQEMGAFAVLFVLTFVVFRLIHPAFRVAQSAEAIFIAFVMGALGLFVISILRGRFEGEMQILFHSLTGISEHDAGYSTVTQKALFIGVNNMKRRRIRTMLTTATIVLIAFTMLSFTSISKKVSPSIISKSKQATRTGFMFHWPGKEPMDEASLKVMQNLFDGHGQSVVRRWKTSDEKAPFYVVTDGHQSGQMEAILGLSTLEDGFLGRIPLAAGRYFSSDTADEVMISAVAAENFMIDADNLENATITYNGKSLRVTGIFDDNQFRQLKDLNDLPLMPIQRIVSESSGSREDTARQSGVALQSTEDINDLGMLFHVNTAALLVTPVETAQKLGALPYSISLKMNEEAAIWPLADMLLTATSARFYISSLEPFSNTVDDKAQANESKNKKRVAAGVYYIGSNYRTSVGGLAVLLIPLFIASTIILNTMLGSVYERKKEIAIYNAIGLNPHHIGLFFLSESFVYGVIGAVGGYLIGQVLSLVISQTGVVTGVNFNYSSLSVAYVILFTIAIVLLSTLYPATVATQAAVPSGKRKWSLPKHDKQTMNVIFPFIYQPKLAAGILTYLSDYFSLFTEASIGEMIAVPDGQELIKDSDGRDRYILRYNVALAPYDLGVTQQMVFDLAYDRQVQSYRLALKITRVSGQDTNWVTTNRPCLERLRKYLMRWRNLNATEHELYAKRAKQIPV